jgi:hypothetical protein
MESVLDGGHVVGEGDEIYFAGGGLLDVGGRVCEEVFGVEEGDY